MPTSDPLECLQTGENPASTRRGFLLASALVLVGCGTRRATLALPGPIIERQLDPVPRPFAPAITSPGAPRLSAVSRVQWTRSGPVAAKMNRMRPVRYLTVHHDGMDPFGSSVMKDAGARLERIRRSHRRRDGGRWGDIGYHYAIDPAGRIWSCRPLSWQGAHVKAHNEGNIGIVMLGNYDRQQVNTAQEAALQKALATLMKTYRVSVGNVRTHQEWAPTACPGRSLQAYVELLRRGRLTRA